MKSLLYNNRHLEFVQKILKLGLFNDDTLVLLRFFHYVVSNDEHEMTFRHLAAIYEHKSQFTYIRRRILNGNYALLTKGLIENASGDGFGEMESLRLTEEVKENFLAEFNLEFKNAPVKGLKSFSSISEKKLYYPEKTQKSIKELETLLQPENFTGIQKRLGENSMRTGFACLFSGGPGTGKTETVYQIARICGRDIMQIDIASVKSKWFGESEKQIKALFDKYRECVRRNKITPILLFNEADAVFTKRRVLSADYNGPGQTENAIQNIILSEIENLNGILIATTNLSANLDSAFERRFLYKINFEKPEAVTRRAIWQTMISDLTDEDASSLAGNFDFSGGQIENIARKFTVCKVLTGNNPSMDEMIRFCEEETIIKDRSKRIGFAA